MILVLEDQEVRIRWLRFAVEARCDVIHVETVDEFEFALKNRTAPSLIILDHDLGDPDGTATGSGKDEHGKDGRDAAKLCPHGVPVVVWSLNRPASQEMLALLADRGIEAAYVSFLRREELLRPMLRTLLTMLSDAEARGER